MYINIYFGLNFDSGMQPTTSLKSGQVYVGKRTFLRWFETQLGLDGHAERIEHLRVEQYRQALSRYKKIDPSVFYEKSFDADQLATAENLLSRRDELLLAGFDLKQVQNQASPLPPRLKVIVDIEQLFLIDDTGKTKLVAGEAERFEAVLQALTYKKLPIQTLFVNEPIAFLPPQYKRLFDILKQQNIVIEQLNNTVNTETLAETDLSIFKQFVENKHPQGSQYQLKGDGSLLILEATNDIEAAAYIAKILHKNPQFKPTFIIPDASRVLDDALIHNGLPTFGLLSTSLGRPTLQLLKLVTAFLWRPLDPHKILEFVTMPSKPLDYELATIIGNVMSQCPGVGSDLWFACVDQYFEKLQEKAVDDTSINVGKIKHQFNFWFDRTTYNIAKTAPKDEITGIFRYLKTWASEEFEASNSKNTSLIVLSEQARRIEEFLNELPVSDSFLTFLELERIIRTIYEPAPVQPNPIEIGHYPHVQHGDCLLENPREVIWWNWSDTEGVHFFSRWYKDEVIYLKNQNAHLQSPQDENALMLWSRIQPILRTSEQLLLVYPQKANGQATIEHTLFSHLRACFKNFDLIIQNEQNILPKDADTGKIDLMAQQFKMPKYITLPYHRLGKTPSFIEVNSKRLTSRDYETLTSLESLFYYPHQWVFKHKARLTKSPILSIVKENTLKGNLAHRFFELALKENIITWTRSDVDNWVNEKSKRLLPKEAAPLLMYGYEPERAQFVSKIRYALWTLIQHIQRNNWTVQATEHELTGIFTQTAVKGKADIVLLRGHERCVLDLKWSGHSYRERLIKNEEDLQLVMYSRLLTVEEDDWAHTAYFIIENARLLARNTAAFAEIKPIRTDAEAFVINETIWQKMVKTYEWRLKQVRAGRLEIRTAANVKELEEHYGDELLDVLEMKKEDSRFDDYRTLIGLVK